MVGKPKELLLHIATDPSMDAEEVENLTRRLRDELLEHDVGSVEQIRTPFVPPGAKGDPATLGTLLVTLAASGGVLTTAINAVQSWLTRQDRRSVTVEVGKDKLVLSSVSSKQQQQLVDDFINQHKK
jgi:hypothetical protein